MFRISEKYNLSICGPAQSNKGIISHKITLQNPQVFLSYTNFVEVNVPLFNSESLKKIMDIFNEELIGWGIDFLYIFANGMERKNAYAIVHKISCINPRPSQKGTKNRELTKIKNCNNRQNIWEKYANSIGCPKKFIIVVHSKLDIEV